MEQQQIIKTKYSQLPISKMNDVDLLLNIQASLFRIHVITGWKLPANEAYQNVLEDQFTKKLQEEYPHFNVNEIELAFRKYSGLVKKEWGTDLNLILIEFVLNKYDKARIEASEIEHNLLPDPPKKEKPTDEQILSIKRETVEVCYQEFLKGKQSIALMPHDAIATLALDGYCEFNLYERFRPQAFQRVVAQLKNEIEELRIKKRVALIQEKQVVIEHLSIGDEIVERMAKKMALVYFFSEYQKQGIRNIYVKEVEGEFE